MIAAWSLIQEHETLCRTTIQLIIKDQFFVIFFWGLVKHLILSSYCQVWTPS